MATTADRDSPHSDVEQMRRIPLSRIVVPEGFNPRGDVSEDRELEQLADSMREHGCIIPIRVRATDHGDYVLIAGARRYRAAGLAALMELPAIIRPVGPGDESEQSELLVEAVVENDQRVDLDPFARPRLPSPGRRRADDQRRRREAQHHTGARARAPAAAETPRADPGQARDWRGADARRQAARDTRTDPS